MARLGPPQETCRPGQLVGLRGGPAGSRAAGSTSPLTVLATSKAEEHHRCTFLGPLCVASPQALNNSSVIEIKKIFLVVLFTLTQLGGWQQIICVTVSAFLSLALMYQPQKLVGTTQNTSFGCISKGLEKGFT